MKFNPGDKVSFINEKQDGVVVKILTNNNVLVAIEDGFDIEVSEKELIKTGVVNLEAKAPEKPSEVVKGDEEVSDILALATSGSVCIAAIPGSIGAVLTGPIQFYLINNCDHQVLFTFYSKIKNNWEGINHGVLQTGENKLIFKSKREDLIDISLMKVQGLLFSPHQLPGTGYFKKEFGVVLPDLQNSNKEVKGLGSYAKVVTVFSQAAPMEEMDFKELIEQYQKPEIRKPVSIDKKQKFADQGIFINEKEVDLHIEELTQDFAGLSNGEIVQIQLNHFFKEMDNAMKNHFKRIIFIHGVGNGRLKHEITKELRSYPGIAFRDADRSKYGSGATEVIFM